MLQSMGSQIVGHDWATELKDMDQWRLNFFEMMDRFLSSIAESIQCSGSRAGLFGVEP